MDEVSRFICKSGATQWTIVRDKHAHFPFKDLKQHMKVLHHFIFAKLTPTMHLSEITRERAILLYGIQKGLKINVGRWIQSNISHIVQQGS